MRFQFMRRLLENGRKINQLSGKNVFGLGDENRSILFTGPGFDFQFTKNASDAGDGILEVGCGIPLKGKQLVPRKNIVKRTVLREVGVANGT